MSEPLLSLQGVCLSFPGVKALDDVSLDIRAGEIVGLVGENGAGKSSLIKLLSGLCRPDAGDIFWGGERVYFRSPLESLARGISTIHQELAGFGHLSVAENLLIDSRFPRYLWGGIHWPKVMEQAGATLQRFGLNISPEKLFCHLTPAQKQEVAIARALSREGRLLILDEPTAALTEPEVKRLFEQLRAFKKEGVATLYVSHRLDEIFELTDRVAVLRDGKLRGIHVTGQISPSDLVAEMIGRQGLFTRERSAKSDIALKVQGLSFGKQFQNISFELHRGEVLGLAGLVGSGRSEVARALYGLYPPDSGEMFVGGRAYAPSSARDALRAGVVYVPEERKRQGLALEHSVGDALSIGFSDLFSKWGLIDGKRTNTTILQTIRELGIKARNPDQAVGNLSGGNQQKTVLGRWLPREPEVLILDEPTRGVDIGARQEIYRLVDGLAKAGKAILLISSDIPELVSMSDHALVMRRGEIVRELRGEALTEKNVILAASGLLPQE